MAPELLIATVGVFLAVAIVAATSASWWLERSAPEQRRLRAVLQPTTSGLLIPGGARLTDAPDPMLSMLSRWVPKSPAEMSRLQKRLTRAGHPHRASVVYYSLAEVALPVALALLVVLLLGLRGGLLPALFVAVLGYVAPSFYIARKTKLRQKAIGNGLPDALDLMTVCVEAGCSLDQALVKTSDELQITHPALAEELRLITTETRAGKPRLEAFRNFATRTGVEDVKTLVSMLTQTDRFGTSVADALRIQADTSRTKRRQAAEERAGKVGVKMVFPLVLCLFPSLYVVCFGPVVVRIYRVFIVNS
jgi:tight adherence protein C